LFSISRFTSREYANERARERERGGGREGGSWRGKKESEAASSLTLRPAGHLFLSLEESPTKEAAASFAFGTPSAMFP